MMLNRVLLSVFVSLLATLSMAQEPGNFSALNQTDQVKKRITARAAQTQSLSSDFIQEKHLTMMEEVLVSKGRFLFKKENNIRWEYYSPINYTILINNQKFVIDNDGKISFFDTETNKLFKEINNMILMAIQGNFVDDLNFNAIFYENKNQYLAILKPQDELLKNIMETIQIFFSKEDMSVTKINFIEPEEDFTLIKFTNRKQNITIADEQFEIKQ
jgi:outer membrane lipoprotein-sorting protein